MSAYRDMILADGAVAHWGLDEKDYADYTGESFNETDGSPPNPEDWVYAITSSVEDDIAHEIHSGQLVMEFITPPTGWIYQFFDSVFMLTGDFDVQVDVPEYTHVSGAERSYFEFGCYTGGTGPYASGGTGAFVRVHQNAAGSKLFQTDDNFYTGASNVARTNDTGLRLRITRVGSTWTTYTDDNAGSWTQRETGASSGTDPVWIRFMAFAGDTAQVQMRVKVDNFTINSAGGVWSRLGLDTLSSSANLVRSSFIQGGRLRLAGTDGHAVALNGTDQFLTRDVADWQIADTQGAIEGWFSSVAAAEGALVASADTGSNTWFMYLGMTAAGEVFFRIQTGTFHNYQRTVLSGLNDGKPHHFAVTSDGAAIKIYIDGADQSLTTVNGSNDGSWLDSVLNRDNVTIGVLSYLAGDVVPFPGKIDEVAYYDAPLTAAQIAEHYQAGLNHQITYAERILDRGPVAYWRLGLDELEPKTSIDDTFAGVDGHQVDPKLWVPVVIGTDADATAKIDSNKLLHTVNYVIDGGSQYHQTQSKHYLQGDFDIQVEFSDFTYTQYGYAYLGVTGIGSIAVNRFTTNRWVSSLNGFNTYSRTNAFGALRMVRVGTQVTTYTKDGAGAWVQREQVTENANDCYFYLRTGLESGYATQSISVKWFNVTVTGPASYPEYYFYGSKDQMGQYPLHWYRPDTSYAFPALVSGLLAADGDKANSLAAAASNSLYGPIPAEIKVQTLTLECWVSFAVDAAFGYFYSLTPQGTAADGRGILIAQMADGTVRVSLGDGDLSFHNVITTGVVDDAQPHHVAMTWDGTTVRIYIDGVEDAADATWGSSILWTDGLAGPTNGQMYLGGIRSNIAGVNPNASWATCTIDEAAMYARVLTPAEILDNYEAGAAMFLNLAPADSHPLALPPAVWRDPEFSYAQTILADNPAHYFRCNDTIRDYLAGYSMYDDFSSINPGGYPDDEKWAIKYSSPLVVAGAAQIRDDGQYRQLRLARLLQGDFSVIVKWEINANWTGSPDAFTCMVRNVDDSNEYRFIYREANGERITGSNGTTYNYTTVNWPDGFFKLERIGTLIKLYYKRLIGDAWIQRSSFSDFTLNADAYFYMYPAGDMVMDVQEVWITADSAIEFTSWRMMRDAAGGALVVNNTITPATPLVPGDGESQSFNSANSELNTIQYALIQPDTGSWTIEAWLKIDTLGVTHTIYSVGTRGVASEPGVTFNVTTSNRLGFILDDGTTQISANGNVTDIAVGEIVHAVAVIDRGNDTARIYHNGVQVSDSTDITGLGTLTSALTDASFFGAGKFTTAIANYLNGDLDQVAIYDHALGDARIQEHYEAGLRLMQLLGAATGNAIGYGAQGTGYDLPDYTSVIAAQTPYLHYRLDEAVVGPLDAIGSRDATTSGILYPGIDSQLLSEPDNQGYATSGGTFYYNGETLDNPQLFCVSAMIVATQTYGTIAAFTAAIGSGSIDRGLYVDSAGKLRYYWIEGGAQSIVSTTTVNDGYPHHVACIQAANWAYLYVDGKLEAFDSTATPSDFVGFWQFADSHASGWPSQGGGTALIGIMDDVAVFTVGISHDELADQYAATRANDRYGYEAMRNLPFSFFRFDEKIDLTWANTVLLMHFDGYHAQTTGFIDETGKTPTIWNALPLFAYNHRSGRTSANFNGTNHYLTFSTQSDFGFGTGALTIEAWILPQGDFTNAKTLFDFRTGTGNGIFYIQSSSGKFAYWNDSANYNGDAVATLGVWQHVAWTYDGTTLRFFLNGILEWQHDVALDFGISSPLSIGKHNAATDYYQGYMDELRIKKGVCLYTDNFQVQRPGERFPDTNVYDLASFTRKALPGAGMERTRAPIIADSLGHGMRFDGTSDNESRLDLGFADNFTAFTVSMWVTPDAAGPTHTGVLVSKNSYFASSTSDFPFALTVSSLGAIGATFADAADFSSNLVLTGNLTLGARNHIVVQFDQNTDAGLWINGVRVDYDNTTFFTLASNARNWCLGADPFPNGGGANTRYLTKTNIDEFTLYDKSLTDTEIEALYAAGIEAISELAVTLDQVPAWALTNEPSTVADAFQVTLTDALAWAKTNEPITTGGESLEVTLSNLIAEAYGSNMTVPNPGIAVGLQTAGGEAIVLKVTAVQGAVSAALQSAIAHGTAFDPLAINSSVSITLPRAEALPSLALTQVDLSGLISNIGAAITQADVVSPLALVGGELAVIGAAQAQGQAVKPSTLLSGILSTLTEAQAQGAGIDMIGLASSISAALGQATAEQIAEGILVQLGGAAITLPAVEGETLSSDVSVDIAFTALDIGVIEAMPETAGPNLSIGDYQVGLDAAVAIGFTPEITITVDFGAGELDAESIVYRFTMADVAYKVTYASAVKLVSPASGVIKKDEQSNVRTSDYSDDVYQTTQENEV